MIYTYTPTVWINDETLISAEHLNNIENGISLLYNIINEKGDFDIYEDEDKLVFKYNELNILEVNLHSINPTSSYTVDLGTEEKQFRNIYFTGVLSNGVSSITFSNLMHALNNLTFSVEGDNASIITTKLNGETGITNLPLATTVSAGLMSPNDIQAINILKGKVEVLENVAHRLLYTLSDNPTATDILNFVIASGYVDPTKYYGIQVEVSATKHVWQWFDNIPAFVDVGILGVTTWTNSSQGSIIGSLLLGQIYAETNGTGSLVGYDKLNNNVATQYNSNNTYEIDDLVIYQGDLYICNTKISIAEAWNILHWTKTNLNNIVKNLITSTYLTTNYYSKNDINSWFTPITIEED